MDIDIEKMEQAGYEAWIEFWVHQGSPPSAMSCPARFMKPGEEKRLFIEGWRRASEEHKND